ncbi:Alkaline and neutral invertase [Filimonas lacunae]|uniref:beta-fructofuranosidase n=1 Tax=Filimonas lacunae TaxID=477680 RepID=A0A173MHW5_9BACT|nr:glycoside hydrolase 100 family protein [Filimonas lacunae]BAV07067.1 hypothetical protein FLA_3087 [Filimonas lacunae]SIS95454.1 Alkaline and neutral invertase [Filimonas lacunae]
MRMNVAYYHSAISLLEQASSSAGFVAAVNEQDNYRRVWTRDGVICSIAALLSKETQLVTTALATLHTLFTHQHSAGFMPSNVHPVSGAVSYGGVAGRADAPAWAVIGVCLYTLHTGDDEPAIQYRQQVEKCIAVMDAWEFNGRHLVYVPQSGDWADEYIQHGYVLFDQLLRVWALQLAAHVYRRSDWAEKGAAIAQVINNNFWKPTQGGTCYSPTVERMWQKTGESSYWLAGFNPSRFYTYFDLQANTLALLLNMGNARQQQQVVGYIHDMLQQYQLVPGFYPVIETGSPDYRELSDNYAFHFRNRPHEFHNGGLWPVWNGFLVMALAQTGNQALASRLALSLHQVNQHPQSPFNECFHGLTALPCGVPQCAWSAAGSVIAECALSGKFLTTSFT